MLNFYANRDNVANIKMEEAFIKHMDWNPKLATPYFVKGSNDLLNKVAFDMTKGMTISAPGFYGPQGRELRLPIQDSLINEKISNFDYESMQINNYEMECSAIYGLSALLGHNALTICLIIANRQRKEYSKDYKSIMKKLVQTILERISS